MSSPSRSEDPPIRGKLLSRLLDEEVDLDEVFDRLIDSHRDGSLGSDTLKAVLPDPSLGTQDVTLAVLLASVLSEYEDIEHLIEGFRELPSDQETSTEAIAVVSEEELGDPEALSRALEPLQERDRFEQLFDTAKSALDQLDPYELSRRPPGELVEALREKGQLDTVQVLVDFLRSLNSAAETFETLHLPTPHIREYLRHLYTMRDWNEMSRLVGLLEVAVSQLPLDSPAASRALGTRAAAPDSTPPQREEPPR